MIYTHYTAPFISTSAYQAAVEETEQNQEYPPAWEQ